MKLAPYFSKTRSLLHVPTCVPACCNPYHGNLKLDVGKPFYVANAIHAKVYVYAIDCGVLATIEQWYPTRELQ